MKTQENTISSTSGMIKKPLSSILVIAKIPKPNAKSTTFVSPDGSLVLFDKLRMQDPERLVKRTFNLKVSTQSN